MDELNIMTAAGSVPIRPLLWGHGDGVRIVMGSGIEQQAKAVDDGHWFDPLDLLADDE